jgi:DNA-binding SARP family transcriptional activator/tetratricopeptide (TPR) repeat protein
MKAATHAPYGVLLPGPVTGIFAAMPANFRVLGPVEIESDGGSRVKLVRRRERSLLGVLLLAPGRVVSVDRLSDLLWDGRPPANARVALRSHVAHVRGVLAGSRSAELVAHGDGYEMCVDPGLVDAHRFEAMVDRAAASAELPARDALLRDALALWRGQALHNAASDQLRQRVCGHLEERRLHAIEESIAVGLGLGRDREMLAELTRLSAEHPVRDRLVELRMTALYRTGRGAEALAVYRRARTHLAEHLGLDPSPDLQRLQTAILRGEPVPDPVAGLRRTTVGCASAAPAPSAASSASSASAPSAPPAQLPADLSGFVGRTEHLTRLDALLADEGIGGRVAVVVGTAGVGKTAIAVRWAHGVRHRFPDGQLYLDLRGFDPAGRVMPAADAVRACLDALGVPAWRIPADPEPQVGLYRSLLAGKRMLVVLDNARDAEQVRPLLPGSSTVVVVTSRNQLTALVAVEGAHLVAVDLLSPMEARELLARRLGPGRVAAEPEAVDSVVEACARLPLALAIAAARAQQTGFPLATVAAELRDTGQRLDVLDAGDRTSQVRAALSWSYAALTPPAARLFRLLGLHRGPNISVTAAASLAGEPLAVARRLLAELVRANLLAEHHPGRYGCHDLLRAYAADLVRAAEPEDTRRAALTRLLDHYTHTAHGADRHTNPLRDPIDIPLGRPADGAVVERLTDDRHATRWFSAEHPVLVAAIGQAADLGSDARTWQLAWSMDTFLTRGGHRHALAGVWRAALRAARRMGDARGRAHALRALAIAEIELLRYDDARRHAGRALALYTRAGDRIGQASAHRGLAYLCWRRGDPGGALGHARQALTLFRAAGHRRGVANELNGVGWYHAELGDHTAALEHCEQALALLHELGDRVGTAYTWDSIGYAHHHLGHHAQAVDCYQRALALHRELGDRHDDADTLTRLGDAYRDAGGREAAHAAWQQALDILVTLNHPDADAVRARLSSG